MNGTIGVYISVPFCRAKCSFCNFASGVFGESRMGQYVQQICAEMRASRQRVPDGAELPGLVDTVYLGGGTPSLLSAGQMRELFSALRSDFDVAEDAEITLECAPGQLEDETLEAMLGLGLNRVSFGVQTFVDRESAAVGRLHTRGMCEAEIRWVRAAGVGDLSLDLIVGLPGQTGASWRESVDATIATGVPHVSVYMLEVDGESRLGREMLASGTRYGAHEVPTEDETADWYAAGCEWLEGAGIPQYEISNFAREGFRSRHNLKYWRREPYLGFGLDAHSMVRVGVGGVRWANPDQMESYERWAKSDELADLEVVGREAGFEEAMFLGLRMNEGVDLGALQAEFGARLVRGAVEALGDVEEAGLVLRQGSSVRLTARGRVASNEVFGRLLAVGAV